MSLRSFIICGLALWAPPASASASAAWTLGIAFGSAYNVPSTLRIEQDGEGDLAMTAHYSTKPWRGSPYYAARLGRGPERGAWEAELIHHKLHLQNTTPEIPHFEATHGYNLVFVNRSVRRSDLRWRAGLGVVIIHLEGTLRGRSIRGRSGIFGSSYQLAGPAAQFGACLPIDLGGHFVLSPEIKLTGAYASVPIEGGHVTVPNVALHGVVGIGYATGARRTR